MIISGEALAYPVILRRSKSAQYPIDCTICTDDMLNVKIHIMEPTPTQHVPAPQPPRIPSTIAPFVVFIFTALAFVHSIFFALLCLPNVFSRALLFGLALTGVLTVTIAISIAFFIIALVYAICVYRSRPKITRYILIINAATVVVTIIGILLVYPSFA